jgi:TonB-linked SusC/RagA family outer membrane protein
LRERNYKHYIFIYLKRERFMEKRLMTVVAGLALSTSMAFAQSQISGHVTSSEDGSPVIGASIKVAGTNTGTVTDIDGNFSLNAPAGAKLEITYIGMNSQTVKAGANLKIVLNPDNKALDEVVVTGYGNFKKSSFTGSASTLNTQGLEDIPVVSLTDKLSGGVPGVSVSGSSSAPGAVSSIRVRGMGSINAGNEPLYVIDGTPMNAGNASAFNSEPGSGYNDAGTSLLATLNSNDIESITVIKDAAAASLYGSRAANGVVVITTKSGKAGKTNVEFRSDWGFSNMAVDYRPQLSGADRRELLYTGLKNYAIYDAGYDAAAATTFADGLIDRFAAKPENGYTDWKDLLFRTGSHSNYQVSVSGGSEKTKFYSSVSYMKQEGILYKQGCIIPLGIFS